MNLISLAVFSVIAVLLAVIIKKINPEYSVLISLFACTVIVIYICGRLGRLYGYFEKLTDLIDVDYTYIKIIIKLMGIAYICEFAACLCKDAGFSAVAAEIELAGRITMLITSIPVVMSVIDMVVKLMG